jgi:hypothetical protein
LLSKIRLRKFARRSLLAGAALSLIVSSGYVVASGWAPFGVPDRATVVRGGSVSVLDSGATSVLDNDFDIEGDKLTAELTREPRRGDVQLNEDGTFVYTHDGSDQDSDSFRYRAEDGTGRSRNTTVSIRIEDRPNSPPFVTGQPPDQVSTEGTAFRLELSGYFGDRDDDDSLRFSMSGLPGRFDIDDDSGVLTGTPSRSDARDAPYVVRITATDEGNLSASLEFLMTIRRDDRSDLKVTARVATNPVTVGSPLVWQVDVENQGARDLAEGELEVRWVTNGPALTQTAPAGCTLNANSTASPSMTCDLGGLAGRETRRFEVQGQLADDGDSSMIAVALVEDPTMDNNASLVGAQVVAAFSEGPTQMLSSAGADVATGDLNGDGFRDVVVTGGETLVFLNTGNRTLQTPGRRLGGSGRAVVVLDWNGDGNADVAVAGMSDMAGRVYLGDGVGGVSRTVNLRVNGAGTVLAAAGADFAQDGFADLVITGTGDTLLLRSSGSDNFSVTDIGAGAGISAAVGDFNNDSFADIVVVESGSRRVRVLRNSGNGRSFSGTGLDRGSVASATTGDIDGDGRDDLLLAIDGDDLEAPESRVLIQRGDGSFPAGTRIGASPLTKLLAGDVDGDSLADIIAVNEAGVHQVYRSVSGVGFVLEAEQIVSDGMRRGVLVDFNSDDSLDLILAGLDAGLIEIHANNGIGRLGLGDRLAPIVTPVGEAQMTIPAGAEYIEEGATAIDDIDGDVAASLVITGDVNTAIVGTYVVDYAALDRAGNKGSGQRIVKVGVNEGTGGGGGGLLSPLFILLECLLVGLVAVRRRQRQT